MDEVKATPQVHELKMVFARLKVKPSFAQFAHLPITLDGWIFSGVEGTEWPEGNSIRFYGHISVDEVAQCSVCGRPLTDPISVAVGMGPVCIKDSDVERPSLEDWSDSAAEALRLEIVDKTTKIWVLPRSGKKSAITTVTDSPLKIRISREDAETAATEYYMKRLADALQSASETQAVDPCSPSTSTPSGRVWLEEGHIVVAAPYALRDICKSIPGRFWNTTSKVWQYPATNHKAREILEALAGNGLVASRDVVDLSHNVYTSHAK